MGMAGSSRGWETSVIVADVYGRRMCMYERACTSAMFLAARWRGGRGGRDSGGDVCKKRFREDGAA